MNRREVLLNSIAPAVWAIRGDSAENEAPSQVAPLYPDHTRCLEVRDAAGLVVPIERPAEWWVRRAHILAHFQEVAGPLPGGERRVALRERLESDELAVGYRLSKVSYDVEPGDRQTAWLFRPPRGPGDPAASAVLCLHQTTTIGKDEPAGLGGLATLHYARELALRGIVTLAPDYPRFGESHVDPYALGYASATMKGVWNHLRAVDLLTTLPEVDPQRIGVIGHSLGGHNAIFAALFDPRIRAVVSSCGFNAFTNYMKGDIAGWSHAGYMPRLRSAYELDLQRVPFDFPELLAALAPRPVFINAPTRDDNFAVDGVRACVEAAQPVYRLLGAPESLTIEHPDAPHDFPDDVRSRAYAFLERRLAEIHPPTAPMSTP